MGNLTTCADGALAPVQTNSIVAPVAPVARPNQPALRGQLASRKVFFGDAGRYALYAVHTRFDAVMWFVADAEIVDEETNLPAIVRQEWDATKAVANLA